MISDNAIIDKNSKLESSVEVGSFSIIGKEVKIGGQTGISGHLSIGNNVKIGGKSGVIADIDDNQTVMGYPAKSIRDFLTDKN